MSIPSRAQAAAVVAALRPNERLLRHSTGVAEVAAFLCAAMIRRGMSVDSALSEAAALLHDVDKMLPDAHPLKPLGHGHAGAEWLRREGMPELAPAVKAHPVMELGQAPSYEAWALRAGLEGRIVTYADKRVRQEVMSLDDRFAKWHAQYPDSPDLDAAHERARQLEAEVCELAGVRPKDVQRLPWVEEQMRAAS
jgi:putative nucleotidyltransferase with HDIG domain